MFYHTAAAILLGCFLPGNFPVAAPPISELPAASLIVLATPEGRSALERLIENDGVDSLDTASVLDLPGTLRPMLRHAAANPELAAALRLDRAFILEGLEPSDLAAATLELNESGLFEAVSINHTIWSHSSDDSNTLPNDPLFAQQYALLNTGQTVGGQTGLPGADINALGAWNIARHNQDITVAVFDAGLSESHPDIAPQLVNGWNFQDDSSNTDDLYTSHGTHVAGIISAVTSNREGIAGLSWNTKLMPIVVLNRFGFGNVGTLAEAIVWTADQGVQVASISLGFSPIKGDADDLALSAAVQYATQQGMLICASSGNVGTAPIGAPARYPETIAVGATDNRDNLWSGTSTGPEMSVVAPGVNILSTWDSVLADGPGEDTYYTRTGTSQAAPHVAGLAALLLSINPGLEPDDLMLIIQRTAKRIRTSESNWDPGYGYGRIDAAAAAIDALTYIDRDLGFGDPNCTADFNHDGLVNSQDFIQYLSAYQARDPRADIAEPFRVFNVQDVIAFLQAYAVGCE